MDFYFFLDNSYFNSAITVSSFPPTGEITLPMKDGVYVCFAHPRDGEWVVETHMQLSEFAFATIHWSDLGVTREVISTTLVFLSHKKLTGKFSRLPFDSSFSSVPSWRANLQIIGNGTTVSYQGEFPYGMTKIKNGSIVSLVPFVQQSSTIKNYFFYASFEQEPRHQHGIAELRDIKSKKVLANFPVLSNKVNCVEITGLSIANHQLLITVTGAMGIPIFFSVDEDGRKMSVEHTMTPSEYAIYGEEDAKRSIMQKMKAYWGSSKWMS